VSDSSEPVDIGGVLDEGQWGGYQRFVVALAALAIIFDGVDIQVLGVAIPSLMADWHVARDPFKWVVAIGLVGMASGSVIGGLIGDRWGRRRALIGSVFVLGVFTAAASFATGLMDLSILRFLAGIGLGGALPNASALSSEYVPLRHRPFAVTLTIVCVPLGASLAGFVAARALVNHSWHSLFAAGGTAALAVALLLWLLLPESPRFLTRDPRRWPELATLLGRIGRAVPARSHFVDRREQSLARASIAALLTPNYRRDTLLLWCAFFSCLLAVYLGFNWLPTMLRDAGLGVSTPGNGLGAFNLGGVAGAIIAALLIQRYGSRSTMLVIALVAIAGTLVMSAMPLNPSASVAWILIMLALTGGAINAVQTTMYALSAHIYPTAVRATGVGAAATIGRLGAIGSAFAGAVALGIGGSTMFFVVMGAAMAVTAVALTLMRRHVVRLRAPSGI
jgi:AAHS family 4-hydroxybenzoate transporter-like MFS transporter